MILSLPSFSFLPLSVCDVFIAIARTSNFLCVGTGHSKDTPCELRINVVVLIARNFSLFVYLHVRLRCVFAYFCNSVPRFIQLFSEALASDR